VDFKGDQSPYLQGINLFQPEAKEGWPEGTWAAIPMPPRCWFKAGGVRWK